MEVGNEQCKRYVPPLYLGVYLFKRDHPILDIKLLSRLLLQSFMPLTTEYASVKESRRADTDHVPCFHGTPTRLARLVQSTSPPPSLLYSAYNHSPTMADKVRDVAVGEADRIKTLTVQAARSAAYLYPVKASCQILPVVYRNTRRSVC